MKIRGLGSKKIKILYEELGISSLGELEYACKENRLALLKGFGEATQKKILTELSKLKVYSKFVLLSRAEEIVDEILTKISQLESISKVAVTGDFRRGLEVISSIELVILASDKKSLLNDLQKIFNVELKEDRYQLKDEYSVPIIIYESLNEGDFTKKLFITTGSAAFIKKLKIDSKTISSKEELGIFESIEFPFIIPEMREPQFFHIKKKKLKKNTDLSVDKFHGLLHFHTDFSDGRNTLKEMLISAQNEGFHYAAVCDHSKSAVYANGLSVDRLIQQKEELTALASDFSLRLFHGIESDILQNGQLDYDESVLKNFDFVVASVHSRFSMEHDEMTKRIIRAVENPYTDLLGHPSGRLLLSREPYKFDVKKVIDACAANKVAIEINANPRRLDLDWRWIYYAREKECLFSINPDAHSTQEIEYIKYGVMVSRKAGVLAEEVINCFQLEDFEEFLNRKVKREFAIQDVF